LEEVLQHIPYLNKMNTKRHRCHAILTRSFEGKEAFHVKGSCKTEPGRHCEHHDNAVDNTPSAPAEPVGPDGRCKQKLGVWVLTSTIDWFGEKT
jgi:hypothetical protein